jgi:hypothetical protein
MQGVELPCDWTVNRRPNNSNNNGGGTSSAAAAPKHQPSSGASRKQQQDPLSASALSEGDCGGGQAKAASSSSANAPIVAMNPLGPRSTLKSSAVVPTTAAAFSTMLPNHGQIRSLVLQHLSTASSPDDGGSDDGQQMDVVVENLLSRLPYKKMLSDMFGGTLRGNLQNSHIPYVTRAYEESFMREVQNSGERGCARGQLCECMFIDRLQPFVGVEFLLPSEERPPTPHLCVLCCRAITQQLYYDVMFDKADFPGVIQRFGNIHSEAGEYALDAMLIAAPTAPVHVMPLPIVSHQRNRYTVYVQAGIKRLRQSRVYFQGTPSCNADSGQ